MPAKKEFTQIEIKDIVDLYCNKFQSMREIGRKYNCANQTIRRVLNEQKCDIRNRYEDLTNQVFGRLKVISLSDKKDKSGNILWKCQCLCKNKTICYRTTQSLHSNHVHSCGCYTYERMSRLGQHSFKNLKNQRFGKLIALEPTTLRKNRQIVWKCKCDCGNICYVPTGYLLSNNTLSCGCLQSKGEQKTQEILIKYNVNYIKEYKFNDCINPKTNHKLRFDFYLPDYNCCIEYDGSQHFEQKIGREELSNIQYRDSIKNKYCEEHNIKLIRIPYTQYNSIEQILISEIFGE